MQPYNETRTILLLARHGETIDNVRKIMQGQTPGQLTPHGCEQAEELARHLAKRHIDAFVSSDLKRSLDTCAIIARPHFEQCLQHGDNASLDDIVREHITTTTLLRERDWGSFTGRYIPDLKDERWTDDIESEEALRRRADDFLRFIKSRYHGLTVLAVGHGIINKAIQAVYFGKEMRDVKRMENAEIRELNLSI